MTARRHHYVPQCYLSAFSGESSAGRIYAIDVKAAADFWTHIRNVAVEHDFNRIDAPNLPIDALENKLANTYESDLANVLAAIRSGAQIEDSHFDALFMFMAFLLTRNRSTRQRISDVGAKIASFYAQAMASDEQGWKARTERAKSKGTLPEDADVDLMRKLILEEKFVFKPSQNSQLLTEFKTAAGLAPIVAARRWLFCDAPPNAAFIASDRPATLSWDDPAMDQPLGLGLKGTLLQLPLSPTLLLLGTFDDGPDKRLPVNEEFVARANARTIDGADRQIYAESPDFPYQGAVHSSPERGQLLDFLRAHHLSKADG